MGDLADFPLLEDLPDLVVRARKPDLLHRIQDRRAADGRLIAGPRGMLAVYDDGAGEGVPVLFLHEDGGRASQWCGIRTTLAGRRRAIALDFAGHGRSPVAKGGDHGFEARAADLAAVVEGLGLARVVVVAHGAASAVALAYAQWYPQRVAGLFLLDPCKDSRAVPNYARPDLAHAMGGSSASRALHGLYRIMAGSNDTTAQRVLEDAGHVSNRAVVDMWRAMLHWDPVPSLFAYEGPLVTLVSVTAESPNALHRLRPDIHCQTVATAGHWIQLDHPRVVSRALDAFLDGMVDRAVAEPDAPGTQEPTPA